MKNLTYAILTGAAAISLSACMNTMDDGAMESSGSTSASSDTSMVGGAEMLASRNIIENASNSPIHTTLVAAVQQAGLVQTLSGPGPFTVFAPTDDAFAKVDDATLNGLMQPSARAQLTQILTYHVVPGNLDAAELTRRIQSAGGTASLTTVEGSTLTLSQSGGRIAIRDETGGTSYVTQADVRQSNGVIHVVDTVLMVRG